MPDWREEIRRRLAPLNLDPAREASIVDELATHAADRYDELVQQGLGPQEAEQRTLVELADSRLPRSVAQLESKPVALFSRRLPFEVRILVKYWKLTAVAVISLAVAMAASVAGLSLVNALILRPPTAYDPGRLFSVHETSPAGESGVSFLDYEYYREHNQSFTAIAAFNYGISLDPFEAGRETGNAVSGMVSENYFDVLGVRPAAGRVFNGNDSIVKAEVVLSYPFWKRLGGDPGMVGKTIKLDRGTATIVGIAPKDFSGTVVGFSIDLWRPILNNRNHEWLNDRNNRMLTLFGRAKPGVTGKQAEADIRLLAAQLARDFPASNKNYSARITPLTMLPTDMLQLARMLSWVVVGIILLVLVAACANVINLLLGLATSRRQEMLIRAALGATRRKLIAQLLRESALICLLSGFLGFGMAWYGLGRLLDFHPVLFSGLPPLLLDLRPDLRVVGLTISVILLLTIAVGILPALYSSVPNLAGALNGEIVVGGTRKRRARNILVVVQTAVCTLVLVGAGLSFRSIEYLKQVPLGFSSRNLVFTYVSEENSRPPDFYTRLREEIQAMPGITGVSLSTSLPLSQNGPPDMTVAEGREAAQDQWSAVNYNFISDNYFSVLGLPVVAGRVFGPIDTAQSPEAAVINQTLARKYWPDQEPIGQRLRIRTGNRLVQIVGIVADSKYDGLDEARSPYIYFAISQHPHEAQDLGLTVSTSGAPKLWLGPVLDRIRKFAPAAFCFQTGTLDDQISFVLLLPRIVLVGVSGFGLLALVLAMAGLYATTSYSVSERRKEIGIRIALGAQSRDLMAALLGQSALVTGIGLVLGVLLSILMSTLLGSLLFGIRPVEGGVLVVVSLATSLLALLTAYLAARPWTKTDPLEAVRHV